jgi:hypothetical protein
MARQAKRQAWTWGYTHPSGACPHEPACTPDRTRCKPQPKQALAHVSLADVLFYGGALGGGKTEFDLVEGVSIALENPFAKVALFRRTLKQHREIISRFRQVVPRDIARYNSQDHVATFYNGAEFWFGYCDREADVYNYQGEQWVALFPDEASHFTEFQIQYLMTRVRSPKAGLRKRIVLTSNPGNVGHGWLKRWFIKPLPVELGDRLPPEPGEIWRPLPKPGDPTPHDQIMTRQFIPAWFSDNLALAEADPNYLAKAWALGPEKGRQLAEGDWDANDSMIVGGVWREQHRVQATDLELLRIGARQGSLIPWHVYNNAHWRPPVGALIFGSVDYGYGAPWSFHLHAALPGGHTRTFFEFYMARKRDAEQAGMIREALTRETFADGQTPLMDGLEWIVMDPSMWNTRQEMGLAKSIAEVYMDILPRVQIQKGAAGRGARLSRPNRWLDALSIAPDGLPWWSVTTACPDLIRTVPEIPWDQDDPEVEDDDSENHAYEDVGRFFEARPHAPRTPPPDPLAHLDPISHAHQTAMAKKYNPRPTVRRIVVPGLG